MTVCKGAGPTMVSAQTVIDWSMTLFEDHLKTVIDWSMTLSKGAGSTMVSAKTVIDRSMTLSVRLHIPPWTQPKLSLTGQ